MIFLYSLLMLVGIVQARVPSNVITVHQLNSSEVLGEITSDYISDYNVATLPLIMNWENQSNLEQNIEIHCQQNQEIFFQKLRLAPKEIKHVEWVLPLQPNEYKITCKFLKENLLWDSFSHSLSHEFDPLRWASVLLLATQDIEEFYPEWHAALELPLEVHYNQMIEDPKWVANNYAAFMGFRNIIWFQDQISLSQKQQNALMDWVLLGGHLVVVNHKANLEQDVLWKDWTETRFKIPPQKQDGTILQAWDNSIADYTSYQIKNLQKNAVLKNSVLKEDTFQVGQGFISLVNESISIQNAFLLLYNRKLNQMSHLSLVQSNSIFDEILVSDLKQNWSELQTVSHTVIVVLSLIFFVLLGPVNLWFRKNSSEISFLLRTPILAFGCVLLVMVVDKISNIHNIRGTSVQIGVLDQRNQTWWSTQQRLYLLRNFIDVNIENDSFILPRPIYSQYNWSPSIHVEDDFPEYIRFVTPKKIQVDIGWHKRIERIGLQFSKGQVQNNFDFPIDQLVYRDAQGQLWRATNIQADENHVLIQNDESFNVISWGVSELNVQLPTSWENVPNNTYIFKSSRCDLTGFDTVEKAMKNKGCLVYGVLP